MFCPVQKIISRSLKIRGALVFLCPRERERERERARARERALWYGAEAAYAAVLGLQEIASGNRALPRYALSNPNKTFKS
jgi:hypothetical protein